VANKVVSVFRRVGKKYYPVAYNKNGSIKPGVVRIKGVETKMEGGNFYLSYHIGSRCIRESVGPDATYATVRRDNKMKELRAAVDGLTAGFTVVPSKSASESEEGKTLEEAKNDYLDEVFRRRDPKSYQNYSITLKLFMASCNKKMLTDVTAEDLQLFADDMRKAGMGKRTVFNRFSNVRSFLKKQGVVLDIDKEDVPKFVKTKPVSYTDDELKKLLAVCDSRERLLYRFALMTGFRLGELMHVEWSDIDSTTNTVWVREKPHWNWEPKAKKERGVPVPDFLIKELLEAKKSATSTLIFPGANGKPEGHMLRLLKAVAERAGLDLERVWIHKFRSTFATGHINNGVPVPTVSDWMGHEDLAATQRYAASISGAHVQNKVNSTFAHI
jgi:integrase/recombinase XerD